jgi:hypothetical protein
MDLFIYLYAVPLQNPTLGILIAEGGNIVEQ